MSRGSRNKPIYIGYLPFGNYPYAIIDDSRLGELLAKRYERVLRILDRCPNAKISLALTGQTKELIAREFPRTYRMIMAAMKDGNLELTQCPYAHPQPLLLPYPSLIEHIRRDIEVTRKYYGVHPNVFWSPECAWSPALPELLSEFGATSIYLRQLPFAHPVWLKGTGTKKIIGFSLGDRPKWNAQTKAAEIRRDFRRLERRLLTSKVKYGFLLVFGDDIEMAGIEDEALLHERVFDVASELPYVRPVLLGEFLKKHPPTSEMDFDRICSWINHCRWWAGDIVDIQQNSSAERIRRNLSSSKALMKTIPHAKRKTLTALREKSVQNLTLLESTEPKGWRPSLDRRLWGYRHAAKGLAYSRNLFEKCHELTAPEPRDRRTEVPLIEHKGLRRTNEPVEVPLSFPEGEFFGDCHVRFDGATVEHQVAALSTHGDGSIDDCLIAFHADAEPNSIGFATIILGNGGKIAESAKPSGNRIKLSSDNLSLQVDLSLGGRIENFSFKKTKLLQNGEHINALYFTPTLTFQRHDDCSPAKAVRFADGPVFAEVQIEQSLHPGIDKSQSIRLYRRVDRLMIETRLTFSHPASLGVYQPWKQNKSDKSLIVGDIRLRGEAKLAGTLPCSSNVIREESLDGTSLRYVVLAHDWAALSTGRKTIGLIADGAVSKFDIARLKRDQGYTHLGYDAGSPSQFGPHYNEERHGFWEKSHRFRLFYVPASADDYNEIRQHSLMINSPLFSPQPVE